MEIPPAAYCQQIYHGLKDNGRNDRDQVEGEIRNTFMYSIRMTERGVFERELSAEPVNRIQTEKYTGKGKSDEPVRGIRHEKFAYAGRVDRIA